MIETPPLGRLRIRSGRKWSRYPPDVLPAWIADMDFAPAPPIIRTIAEALALGDFGYGPPAVDSGVAEAFARWAKRRWSWCVAPRNVMLMPDVVSGIANAIEALTVPGDAILVQTPAYPPLMHSVTTSGRVLIEHQIDAADILEETVARTHPRMLLLCHPHNPSGRVFAAQELARFATIAEAHDLIVVSDEVHADLTLDGLCHIPFATLPGMAERTVTLNSPSKAFNIAGLRIALCVALPRLGARLAALPPTRWSGFSAIGLRAARAAWSEEGELWLEQCVTHLSAMRDRIGARLPALDIAWQPPQASYLAWLDFRGLLDEDPATFLLRKARVALSPGPDFGSSGAGFARLNFATSADILDEIFDRIERALSG